MDLYEVIHGDSCLCFSCQEKLVPHFDKFDVEGIDCLSIYQYDDNIKSILYQYKGCYDIELSNVFLNRYKQELHLMYRGYIILPAPSYYVDDEKRQFKHVDKMFEILNLPICNFFRKTAPFKQAEHKRRERKKIEDFIILDHPELITGKKVLIVDDVSTTGATLRALIKLVKEAKPKKIKALVMSKRVIS